LLARPLFSDISIPFPWLLLGGACFVAGALSLWRVRNLAASPVPDQPESSRSFFAVLGIFNILIFAVSLSVQAEKWRGVIWALAALGILLCAVALVRRVSK
jgi:hypothetical protein